jgi:SAM-dependent methyltransferase/uncharacterized protein YbaR (Trm112 family)
MKRAYLEFLHCPECHSDLALEGEEDDRLVIGAGRLTCTGSLCGCSYPIVHSVPRFVSDGKYADSFGAQWRTFAKTQLDGDAVADSRVRWDSEIGWRADELRDKTVIEFGSGAGRFVEVASRLGAKLAVGMDITDAVDASQDNLGDRDNCFFVQADFFHSPLKPRFFDFGYSIGVLHHTPDPEGAFQHLVSSVSDHGSIGLSLYDISLFSRPNLNSLRIATIELFWSLNMWRCELFRHFTTRLPPRVFLAYCRTVVPILHVLNKIPIVRYVRYLLPSTCYRSLPVEWSMVDTHDTYATKIVHQYRAKDVFQWFMRAGLFNTVVMNGRAGWVSLVGTRAALGPFDHQRYVRAQPPGPGLA